MALKRRVKKGEEEVEVEQSDFATKTFEEEEQDLQTRLGINMDKLDEEIISQPALFQRAAGLAARLRAEADSSKEEARIKEAAVYLAIRDEKEKKGEKITEALINAEVRMTQEVIDTNHIYSVASQKAEMASILKESFIQRSHMLRNIVELTVCGYLQTSGFTRSLGEAGYKAAKAKINEQRNKS